MSFKQKIGDSVIEGDFSDLEKLARELGKGYYIDIGILGGNSTNEDGITIAGLGAVHEFGRLDGTIPSRSFIRMPIEKKSKDIQKSVDKNIQGKMEIQDIHGLFKIMGIAAESVIMDAFDTGGFGQWQDIKEETKNKKGSEAILIDDGTLRKAITSKVGKK